MQVTIQSFWKSKDNDVNGLKYLDSTIGQIYSPVQILSRNLLPNITISEEQLLATLASYGLKACNEQLYSTLVERISKKSPQYIVDNLLCRGETTRTIKTLYKEDAIYNAIKDDKVCQYLYFDEYYFTHANYYKLNQTKDLEEQIFYSAAHDIGIKKQVNRYNYMGISYYYNTEFLLLHLDQTKIKDEDILNYLIPNLSSNIKNDPKLWLHLISLPRSFIAITPELFRVEHFEEFKSKNKKRKALSMFFLSLSKENKEKYTYLFPNLKLSKKELSQSIPKDNFTLDIHPTPKSKQNTKNNSQSTSLPHYKFNPDYQEYSSRSDSAPNNNPNQPDENKQKYMQLFSKYQTLLESIYQKYYPYYTKILNSLTANNVIKEDISNNKDNFERFLTTILLNQNNFNLLYQDPKVDIITFNLLIRLLILSDPSTSRKLQFYMLEKRKKELQKYYSLIISSAIQKKSLNYLKYNQILREQFIESVIQAKALFQKEKAIILKIVLKENNDLTAYDINYLSEQIKENQITMNELLNNHEITKTCFYKIYQDTLTLEPSLANILNIIKDKDYVFSPKVLIKKQQ